MANEISKNRKVTNYIGKGIALVGFAMFFVPFIGIVLEMMSDNPRQKPYFLIFWPVGMFLIFVGILVATIGSRGLAGSGVVLDPAQARRDLEPHSRMVGGVIKDVIDEANINLGGAAPSKIMIRCRSCSKLNEEDSKFCQECGRSI